MVSERVKSLLGGVWIIELKAGGKFWFKVTEAANENGREWIRGFDDEMLNLQIDVADIYRINAPQRVAKFINNERGNESWEKK